MQRDHYISYFDTMPDSFFNLTLDQVVKQYGLHNLAPLIMLQAKLSSKLYYLNIFPKL